MPTTADRPYLMVAVAALRRIVAESPWGAHDLDVVIAELDRRGLEVKDLKDNQRRLAAEYHATVDQLESLHRALLDPDQPTAIRNLIALRAETNQTNNEDMS